MSETQVKFKFRIGELEVEYEGIGTIPKEDILELSNRFIELHESITPATREGVSGANALQESTSNKEAKLELTLSSIATKLKAKTTTDLAFAACAKLALVDQKEKSSRSEIHETMRTDSSRYKKNMNRNLTQSLRTLVNQERINEVSKAVYALSSNEKNSLEAKLDVEAK